MTKFGETLLLMLNRVMPDSNRALLSAKQDPLTYLEFVEDRAATSFAVFGDLNFTGQDVMDVGCGLGSDLAHICRLGPRRVVALDLNSQYIQRTRSMVDESHPDLPCRIEFAAADAADMPFTDQVFDVLICMDTFEHVEDLLQTLRACSRVLRPGGHLYAFFPPFYAPWGAHMINWIRLPWCQVFFAESTVLSAARQLEDSGLSVNLQLPPETRLDLQDGDTIPFVNHLTLHRFERTLLDVPGLRKVRVQLLPPAWRTGGWIPRLLQPLCHVPLVQEMFTAKAVFVLQKV